MQDTVDDWVNYFVREYQRRAQERIPEVLSSLHGELSRVATDHDHSPALTSTEGPLNLSSGGQRPAPLHERARQRNVAIT